MCSTITGQRVFYAGGGGGGGYTTYLGGKGGAGGGSDGTYNFLAGTSAQANTGGGSGGTGSNASGSAAGGSGSGGSGIVIIRYPQNLAPPASTTGNPQILYNNGYQIYIWTSSGTITF
jgi:hypothetical protein